MTNNNLTIEGNLVLSPEFKKKLESTVFAIKPIENGSDEYIVTKKQYTDGKVDDSLPPKRYEISLTCTEPASEMFLTDYVFCATSLDDIDGYSPKDTVKVRVSDNFQLRQNPVNKRLERAYEVRLVSDKPND
jgi:hypothetical protein